MIVQPMCTTLSPCEWNTALTCSQGKDQMAVLDESNTSRDQWARPCCVWGCVPLVLFFPAVRTGVTGEWAATSENPFCLEPVNCTVSSEHEAPIALLSSTAGWPYVLEADLSIEHPLEWIRNLTRGDRTPFCRILIPTQDEKSYFLCSPLQMLTYNGQNACVLIMLIW